MKNSHKDNDILSIFRTRKDETNAVRTKYINKLQKLDNFFRSEQWLELSNISNTTVDSPKSTKPNYLNNIHLDAGDYNINENGSSTRIEKQSGDEGINLRELEYRQTNILNYLVNIKAGNMLSLTPQPEVRTENPSDVDKVEKMQAVIDTVWDKKNMDDVVKEAIWLSKWKPLTITLFTWNNNIGNIPTIIQDEPTKGDFEAHNIDPMNAWWDISATKIEDMDYFIFAWSSTKTKIREQFKDDLETLELLTDKFFESVEVSSSTDSGENYNDRDNTNKSGVTADRTYTLNTYYTKTITNEGQTKISCHYILGNDKVIKSVDDIGIPIIPIAVLKEFNIPQSFFGISTGELVLPAQKTLSILEMKEAILLRSQGKEIIFYNSTLNIDRTAISQFLSDKKSGSTLITGADYNTAAGGLAREIHLLNIGQSELNSLHTAQELTIQRAKQTVGVSDTYEASSFGSQQSKGGIIQAMGKSATIDDVPMQNLNIYLNRMFTIIMYFIKNLYTPRVFNVDTSRQSVMNKNYSPEIFLDQEQGSSNVMEQPPMEQPPMGEGMPPMEAMLGGMGGGNPMESIMGGGQPPMGGNPMEGAIPQMGGGMPPMGGMPQAPNPMDKYKQLSIGANDRGEDDEEELGNEFKNADFNIDVHNSTSAQKDKNTEFMITSLDRLSQQMGLIPSEISRIVFNNMGLEPNFVNKYCSVVKELEDKKEQQEQQAMQMQNSQALMQQQGGQNKIMADLMKTMMNNQAKTDQMKATPTPPIKNNSK